MNELLVSSLGIIIVTATILVLFLKQIHIPPIVTYIVVGLLAGPLLAEVLPYLIEAEVLADSDVLPDTIEMIGEVGIALLLFIVGLELNLDRIRDVGKVALYAGIGQVVFTAAGGFGLCLLLGFDTTESIFLAIALTFSSTVVVVKLLDQKKEFESLYGRIAVGILLVQDVVVIVALTFVAGVADPETLAFSAIAGSLGMAFLGMGALLTVSILASRYFLARPFRWASQAPETLFIWSLGWCFLFVILAEVMHLSPELGAFLAGISLAQLKSSHDLRRRIHPLMNFFIAIFFVSLGAEMELDSARDLWIEATWLSLFVLVGKAFILMLIITRSGYSQRTSFLSSATLAQISEFSFVLAAMGHNSGIIGQSVLSVIALVGLITIGLSSYMILYNHQLYKWVSDSGLLRIFAAPGTDERAEEPTLKEHIVLVGLNTMGRRIARLLDQRSEQVVLIDNDSRKLETVPGHKVLGSVEYLSTTEEANLVRAKLAISTLKIEDVNNLFALRCKQLGVPVAIHLFDNSVLEDLKQLDVDFIIDSKLSGVEAMLHEVNRIKP